MYDKGANGCSNHVDSRESTEDVVPLTEWKKISHEREGINEGADLKMGAY